MTFSGDCSKQESVRPRWPYDMRPSPLADYCVPVSTVPGRQHLRSASSRQLIVPRVRRSTFGARAFAIAGPTV